MFLIYVLIVEIGVAHGYGHGHPLSLPQLIVFHEDIISKDVKENGLKTGVYGEIGEIVFENVL